MHNVTHYPDRFVSAYGTQVQLYLNQLERIKSAAKMGIIKLPPMPSAEIIAAIKITGK
jgi:hypothetical protein